MLCIRERAMKMMMMKKKKTQEEFKRCPPVPPWPPARTPRAPPRPPVVLLFQEGGGLKVISVRREGTSGGEEGAEKKEGTLTLITPLSLEGLLPP